MPRFYCLANFYLCLLCAINITLPKRCWLPQNQQQLMISQVIQVEE